MGDKMKRIMLTLTVIIITTLLCYSSPVHANDAMSTEIIGGGESFLNIGKGAYANNKPLDEGALNITSREIFNLLFAIAAVLAIGVGLVIGIQFITGSVDEKAKIKETLVPYIVGCIVIFSAFTIWKIVMELGNEVEGTTTVVNTSYISSKNVT